MELSKPKLHLNHSGFGQICLKKENSKNILYVTTKVDLENL